MSRFLAAAFRVAFFFGGRTERRADQQRRRRKAMRNGRWQRVRGVHRDGVRHWLRLYARQDEEGEHRDGEQRCEMANTRKHESLLNA
jgi:hypothetical protein